MTKPIALLLLLVSSCAACTGPPPAVAASGTTTTTVEVVDQDQAWETPAIVVQPPTTTTTTTTAPPPPPPPTTTTTVYVPSPTTTAPPVQATSTGSVWDDLADCESGDRDAAGNPIPGTARWSISTGNGYYGGLQFSLSSWQAVGGTGYPHEHPRATQIEMGRRLQADGGWGHWPDCSRKLGLR